MFFQELVLSKVLGYEAEQEIGGGGINVVKKRKRRFVPEIGDP